jgi:hypothetical protein
MIDYDWFDFAALTSAEYRGNFRVYVSFDDGTAAEIDLSHLRRKGDVFEAIHHETDFAGMRFDPELRTVVWPNGADVAPETLYHLARGRRLPQDVR